MRREILSYLRMFFVASVVIIFLLITGVGFFGKKIGATITLDQLARIQAADHDKIVLPFDLRYWAALKLSRVSMENPEVIFISSSRAGAVRAEMLHPYSFYNMSFTAWTLDQVIDVFDSVTRANQVHVAIIELDYFMFTDAWERNDRKNDMIFNPIRYLYSSGIDMLQTTARHPQQLIPFIRGARTSFLGTQAILSGEGFRFDGSYAYSDGRIKDAEQRNMNASFLVNSMPGASSISTRQMELLRKLAKLAQERNVILVGIQLPFLKEGVEYLDTNESYHTYSGVWREFESASTRQSLQEMGIHFFDLARDPLNSEKENFIDAYHPSNLGMLRSIKSLLSFVEFRDLFPAVEPQRIDRLIAKENMDRPQ